MTWVGYSMHRTAAFPCRPGGRMLKAETCEGEEHVLNEQNEAGRRTPDAIDLATANGLMQITGADGHASLYELPELRRRCPCAGCAGELGRPGLVTHETVFTPRQVTLAELQPLNRFGLQFVWADGHDDGLFSYGYLRDLCPCDDCVAERISR